MGAAATEVVDTADRRATAATTIGEVATTIGEVATTISEAGTMIGVGMIGVAVGVKRRRQWHAG